MAMNAALNEEQKGKKGDGEERPGRRGKKVWVVRKKSEQLP